MNRLLPGPARLRPDEETLERFAGDLGRLHAIAVETGNRGLVQLVQAVKREWKRKRAAHAGRPQP